jgi:hypothetical protein
MEVAHSSETVVGFHTEQHCVPEYTTLLNKSDFNVVKTHVILKSSVEMLCIIIINNKHSF